MEATAQTLAELRAERQALRREILRLQAKWRWMVNESWCGQDQIDAVARQIARERRNEDRLTARIRRVEGGVL